MRVKSVFLLSSGEFFPSSRAASVTILPSALFVERFSLGASWAFPFQQVLLPDNRPRLPSLRRQLGQDLVAVTCTRRLSSAVRMQLYATALTILWLFLNGS
jgi:hypothetical protein